ncbi:MAG: hypothetical protein HQK50_06755 [Oligoflexia bacterium]|nr:hypothetical protein [Oligoflexia bacterium]MBF0365253.1 hypothetical protein [Oligoflexia bacterium]
MKSLHSICGFSIVNSFDNAKKIANRIKAKECPLCKRRFRSKNRHVLFCTHCRKENEDYLSDDWFQDLSCLNLHLKTF